MTNTTLLASTSLNKPPKMFPKDGADAIERMGSVFTGVSIDHDIMISHSWSGPKKPALGPIRLTKYSLRIHLGRLQASAAWKIFSGLQDSRSDLMDGEEKFSVSNYAK